MTPQRLRRPVVQMLGLALLGWVLCAVFVDRGLAFQALYVHAPALHDLLAQAALITLPLPWVALTAAWGLATRRQAARKALFVITVWGATTLAIDVVSIVIGHYRPRAWMESLVAGQVADPVLAVAFLGNNTEALWGLVAGAILVSPHWRPVLVGVGLAASALRVAAGEAYAGDSLLAAGIALACAAAVRPLFAAPAIGDAQSRIGGDGSRPSSINL